VKNTSLKKEDPGTNVDKGLYREFAHLAADWIWELDANLCYVFHDGRKSSLTGLGVNELAGRNRIDVLNESLMPSEQLIEHHNLMQRRENIDVVLPFAIDGSVRHIQVIAEAQFDGNNVFTGYKGCGRDVSRRVALETQLLHLATHDDLTGVINRREFERKLGNLHRQAREGEGPFSLCFIDLDKFKNVNDTGGHHAGDQLLRELVALIRKHVQSEETVARLGGDEFGLLLHSDANASTKIAEKIIDEISRYNFLWEDKTFRVGASIGIAEITSDSESVDSLMVKADNACYAAKHNGRNQSHVSDEEANIESNGVQRVDMIERALKNSQYKLLMQPIASVNKDDELARYELLVRLVCNNGELLEPGEFMPLAKKYSLMQELDYWVVENALLALGSIQADGEDASFSINLSASTMTDVEALNRIITIFNEHPVPKHRVCIDLTETYAIRNIDAVSAFMGTLKNLGVEFALDDFGNGLSSFTYLQNLPINYLKIDGELIRKLSTDETVRCITSSFHELSKKLGMKTVAESVEDSETAAWVKAIGIDFMQGFGVAGLIELDTRCPIDQRHKFNDISSTIQ